MKPQISLITILCSDVQTMTPFYRDVLGFSTKSESENYVEFQSEGVRFALCSRSILESATGDASYQEVPKGHSFELAFPCESAEDVRRTYDALISKGARGVKEPATMPWGQTTAFFADPEGNIHEIFAD